MNLSPEELYALEERAYDKGVIAGLNMVKTLVLPRMETLGQVDQAIDYIIANPPIPTYERK